MFNMLILIFVCSLIVSINAHPCANIVGGSLASERSHPYQASIRNKGNHTCSGAIIDERHILTSSLCAGSILKEDLTIVVGINFLETGGLVYDVEEIIIHEDLHNPIALLRTTDNIIFENKVKPIPLPSKDYREAGTPILITGWGTLLNGTILTQWLNEVNVKLYDQDRCASKYPDVNESVFCAIERCGTHLCQIDVGSPLITDGVLIGIKSLGYNCNYNKADMHIRVYHFLDWIAMKTKIEPKTTTTTETVVTEECF